MNSMEEWRDVKGYEGLYQVSNEGRVRSLDRIITQKTRSGYYITRKYAGIVLKQTLDKDGYGLVTLSDNNRKQKQKRVHILVAQAFIPNPDNKPQIDHIIPISDGGTNEASNLRWVTPKENARNSITFTKLCTWKRPSGKDHYFYGKKRPGHAKKMSITIVEIKEDGSILEWESTKKCAEAYGVSPTHLSNAVNGKNHKIGHFFKASQFYKKDEYEKMVGKTIIVPPTIT